MLLGGDDLLTSPYATTPPRIADEIADALRAVPAVCAIARYGSLAQGRHDGLSDSDLLVAHEGGPAAARACAEAIRAAKPVRYYQPSSDAPPPAGRYWFDGESPLHQLNAGFHAPADYKRMLADGTRAGHALVSREIWRRTTAAPAASPIARSARPTAPVAAPGQHRESHDRYVDFFGIAKRYLRGECARDEYAAAWKEFLARTRGVRMDARSAAGRIGELIQECWQVRAASDRAERGG
ncbi:MAG: hypothetical protein FJZ92_08985 [Chloroflexi bacterium]|nr:hypothetical protein [Chloroflexota bacterium]